MIVSSDAGKTWNEAQLPTLIGDRVSSFVGENIGISRLLLVSIYDDCIRSHKFIIFKIWLLCPCRL